MKTSTFRMDMEKIDRLDQMAKDLNRSRSWIINQAVDRFLEHEEWFVKQVEEGIKAAENGDFASEEEIADTFRKWGAKID